MVPFTKSAIGLHNYLRSENTATTAQQDLLMGKMAMEMSLGGVEG